MSWQTLYIERTVPKRATENLKVYKFVLKNNRTPYKDFKVEYNKVLPKVEIKLEIPRYAINEGYHSYSFNLGRYVEGIYRGYVDIVVGEMHYFHSFATPMDLHIAYIPKGTKYYDDEKENIVSESLVITDEIVEPIRLEKDLVSVVILEEDKPKITKCPYSKLEEMENIAGVVLYQDNDYTYFVSMQKNDWSPYTLEENGIRGNFLPCSEARHLLPGFDTDTAPQIYRYCELINGSVDWNMPYFNRIRGQYMTIFSNSLTSEDKVEYAYYPRIYKFKK